MAKTKKDAAPVLQAPLDHLGLACPEFEYLCTDYVSKHLWPDLPNPRLGALAAHVGHAFHHHNPQADAEAAGRVLLAIMDHVSAKTPRELLDKTRRVPRGFCQ
jgi:DNA polymerase III subunit epsilon